MYVFAALQLITECVHFGVLYNVLSNLWL